MLRVITEPDNLNTGFIDYEFQNLFFITQKTRMLMQKHIVVVLGMHRSGTSVITRALKALNIDLGDRLIPSHNDNKKGYWEDIDINNLNVKILSHLGYNWQTLVPVLPEEVIELTKTKFKDRAIQILNGKLLNTYIFGLKDPRINRLLPFWKDVFDSMRVKVSYIIACRNPMSVARSLKKRDGFEFEKSYFLWTEHTILSLYYTQHDNRIIVDYDNIIENPEIEITRLSKFLNINFSTKSASFQEYKKEFLETSLRHTSYSIPDLFTKEKIPPNTITLFRILKSLTKQDFTTNDPDLHEKIKHQLKCYTDNFSALSYMHKCEAEISHLKNIIHDQQKQIGNDIEYSREKDDALSLVKYLLSDNTVNSENIQKLYSLKFVIAFARVWRFVAKVRGKI